MSCEREQPLSFNECRAVFRRRTNGVTEAEVTIEQRNANGTTTTEQKNLVAKRMKIFESANNVASSTSTLKPMREAPPPPPAAGRKTMAESHQNRCLLPAHSLLENQDQHEMGMGSERNTGVQKIIERLNENGLRMMTTSDWQKQQKSKKTRLKEPDEEPESAQESTIMSRKSTNSEESNLDPDSYSYLSDTTTTATGPSEQGNQSQSSFGPEDILSKILKEMRGNGLFNRIPAGLGRLRSPLRKPPPKDRASDPPPCCMDPIPGLTKSQTEPSKVNGDKDGDSLLLRPLKNCASQQRRRTAPEQARAKTQSVASTQSGSTCFSLDESFELPIPHYETGDEKEDKRLRELHLVAVEFLNVQRTFVDLLHHIGDSFPKYLAECQRQTEKTFMVGPGNGTPHVVEQIASHFRMILAVHRVFEEDFAAKVTKWDSRRPDMAQVFQQKAEFLKICSNFLKVKRTLATELQHALEENRDLAEATRRFEQGMAAGDDREGTGNALSLRGISIVMQLDAVHQNVVRYKLLMERYRKYLPADLLESSIADEALDKLTAVSNTVNQFLTGADADNKLLDLHRKLQGVFDVFAPGRKLLHEGELRKQTRKELQPRYLILFSDTLLTCRYSALGADSFDASRIYKTCIGKVQVHSEDHEDHECEFAIHNPQKSNVFVAKSRLERNLWVERIREARRAATEANKQLRSIIDQPEPTTVPRTTSLVQTSEVPSPGLSPLISSGVNGHDPCDRNGTAEKISVPAPAPDPSIVQYPPVWIPDNRATKCLMAGCGTRFNVSVWRRKHHCRQCGWLICNKCVGQAPVRTKQWEKVKICPQCYEENKITFERGLLFPPDMVLRTQPASTPEAKEASKHSEEAEQPQDRARPKFSLDDPTLRISYDGGARLVAPVDLFVAPANGILSKALIPVKEQPLAFGKVFLRTRKGVSTTRWARLTREFFLQFYEAEFDDLPNETFFVYGYSVSQNETEDGNTTIELTHRNQFQTDRKEDQIIFHVPHTQLAEKWLEALNNLLVIDQPLESPEEERAENNQIDK